MSITPEKFADTKARIAELAADNAELREAAADLEKKSLAKLEAVATVARILKREVEGQNPCPAFCQQESMTLAVRENLRVFKRPREVQAERARFGAMQTELHLLRLHAKLFYKS